MKTTLYLFIALLLLAGCAEDAPPEQSAVPVRSSDGYLGTPKLFAPGAVSTELPEFATAFTNDGMTVFFNVLTADRSSLKIVSSSFDNTKWTPFIESEPHEVLIFYEGGDYLLSPWNNAEEIKTCRNLR